MFASIIFHSKKTPLIIIQALEAFPQTPCRHSLVSNSKLKTSMSFALPYLMLPSLF
jgi:hypothetical protein